MQAVEKLRSFRMPQIGGFGSGISQKLKTNKKQIAIAAVAVVVATAASAYLIPELVNGNKPSVKLEAPVAIAKPVEGQVPVDQMAKVEPPADALTSSTTAPAASATPSANTPAATMETASANKDVPALPVPPLGTQVMTANGTQIKPVEQVKPAQAVTSADRALLEQINEKLDRIENGVGKSNDMLVGLRGVTDKISTMVSKVTSIGSSKPVRQDYAAVSILDISPSGVVISDAGKKSLVKPGEKMPGGTTFIGFDPVSRIMKTDRGDFQIPA
jgi:hypothetical protein